MNPKHRHPNKKKAKTIQTKKQPTKESFPHNKNKREDPKEL
jgi:hypothetical protein